mgnify:CR=1 FL=1
MQITGDSLRAALGLANLSGVQFSEMVGVNRNTISRFLQHEEPLSGRIQNQIEQFFQNRGIVITENGAFKDTSGLRRLTGKDGFQQLYEDYYNAIKNGGEMRLDSGVSVQVIDGLGKDYVAMHVERMKAIRNIINVKTLVGYDDDTRFGRDYAAYRRLPASYLKDVTVFIYANKTAYVMFGDTIDITVIINQSVADYNASRFDLVWNTIAREFSPDDSKHTT